MRIWFVNFQALRILMSSLGGWATNLERSARRRCSNPEMVCRFESVVKMAVKFGAVSLVVLFLVWSIDLGHEGEASAIARDSGEEAISMSIDADTAVESKKTKGDDSEAESHSAKSRPKPDAHEVPCLINGESVLSCRKSKDGDIFMPWSFVGEHFEVTGHEESNGTFCFRNSYADVTAPPPTYKPGSPFMSMARFQVGYRKRVKVITGTEGVPLTTQWNDAGYHYPTQVAQFGLSHHAKYVQDGEPTVIVLENGEGVQPAAWVIPKNSEAKLTKDMETQMNVLEFKTSDSLKSPGIHIKVPESTLSTLSVDLMLTGNGSFSVLAVTNSKSQVHIHYVLSDELIEAAEDGSDVYIGLGQARRGQWFHMARDLTLDLMKGLKILIGDDERRLNRDLRLATVLEIRLRGTGMIDNLAVQSHVNKDQFFDAADWLVKHQDSRGGWPIPCPHKLPGTAQLQPGWYTAMGQGQAISVLSRAYFMTRQQSYLDAAARGMIPYDIDSTEGGVRAVFFDKYVWYEEYPTQPASFVLNGFIYALLGVYDLQEVADGKVRQTAERIYGAGLVSLKAMLGMFDAGTGTIYDLRHVTAGIEPNRARWDYHTTHIELLMQMVIIDGDPLFKKTYKRWQRYLKGIWSGHN